MFLGAFEFWVSLMAQMVKNLHARQETQVQSLGWENPLQKGMATYSSIFAWRVPWTEEPGGLSESDMTERLTLRVLQELHMLDLQNLCNSQVKTVDSSCLKLKEASLSWMDDTHWRLTGQKMGSEAVAWGII